MRERETLNRHSLHPSVLSERESERETLNRHSLHPSVLRELERERP